MMGSYVDTRIESFPRGADLLPGFRACVHDALWLLARQWQLGELDGSDAGTPITARLVTRATPVVAWQPGNKAPAAYTDQAPLEALAESDGMPLPWRDRVAAGLRLVRDLRRAGVDPKPLVVRYPLGIPDPAVDPDADPDAHATSSVTPDEVVATASVTAGRVPDPDVVAGIIDAQLDAMVAASGRPDSRAVFQSWRKRWATIQPHPSGAWQPQNLEYELAVAVADQAAPAYTAPDFKGGALDWFAFDVVHAAETEVAKATTPAAAQPTVTTTIPVPVTFHGSPVGRYWQLEDARIDLGALDTYPTEIGKLLLAEFSACFAGDWYRLPVRVPYGCAVHVDALVTCDTFGVATLVPDASAASGPRPWRMYEHSGSADGSWVLVPPVLAGTLESEPVEEVAFVRDPAADMVWGIERTVSNAVGQPVRRSEDLGRQGRVVPPDPRAAAPDAWMWRLQTTVPENWIPFLPTRGRGLNDDYLLVQGTMIRYRRTAATLASVPILPASLMLRDGLTLPERTVPREGVSVRRTRRTARWADGSRVSWWSRRAIIGHGEASSGLANDGLHPDGSTLALGQ
jgi:hypothetical protein